MHCLLSIPQHSRIAGQTRNAYANVIVDLEELFLETAQRSSNVSLHCHQHGMRGRSQCYDGAALLHSFECILHLVKSALGRKHRYVIVVLVPKLSTRTLSLALINKAPARTHTRA